MDLRLELCGISDPGRVRARNEDALALDPAHGVAVVADGMGGHPGGDVASGIAAAEALAVLGTDLLRGRAPPRDPDAAVPILTDTMRDALDRAHEGIRRHVAGHPELEGMGTTLTALRVHPPSGTVVVGHVGDSRAYRLRRGTLLQLTRDHTWVQRHVDAGLLTPEQARHHPRAHILSQCVGVAAAPVPEILTDGAEAGDVYLLCSDGLVGMLEDDAIREILSHGLGAHPDPEALHRSAKALVDAANENGGFDNITVALVLVGRP